MRSRVTWNLHEFAMIMCFLLLQSGFLSCLYICMLHDFKFPSTIPTDTSGSAARKDALT